MRKIFLILLILILTIGNSSAALLTSSATPSSIFKCGSSTISATFSDVGITGVNATLTSTQAVQPMIPGSGRIVPEMQSTHVNLTNNSNTWAGIFGNDATLLWGTRSITYEVLNGGTNIYPSSTTVFIYSDTCVGTNKTNYTQIITPMGNYTRILITNPNMDLITWSLYPWVQYWGFLFYFLVMGTVCSVIYLKTQNITQPLIVGIVLLLVVVGTQVIPETWRNGVIFVIALVLAVIYYRVFTRE